MSLSVLDELRAKSENVQKAGHANTAALQREFNIANTAHIGQRNGATPEQKIAVETAKRNLAEAQKANLFYYKVFFNLFCVKFCCRNTSFGLVK